MTDAPESGKKYAFEEFKLFYGIANLRLTKCEMIQYRVFKKIVTAIYGSHVSL